MKKLSVIITAYNQPESIARILTRIGSVPWEVEIIVVDDHSDAEAQLKTLEVVSDFHVRTGAGLYEYMTTNGGCGGARNFGVGKTSGDWLWFVDGDDELAPGAIDKVIEAIDRAKTSIIAIGYEIRKAGGETSEVIPSAELNPWEWSITAWSKIVRRSIFKEFAAPFVEDNDWWFRECLESPKMDVLPGICYVYYKQTPGSVTAIFDRIWQNSKANRPLALHKLVAAMDRDAWVVAAMLGMMGRLIKVRCEAVERKVPDGLVAAIDFAIKYFERAIVRE